LIALLHENSSFMKKFILILSGLFVLSACQQTDSLSEVDFDASAGELSEKPILCSQVQNPDLRTQCEQRISTVAGQILTQEVMMTFDLERCGELPHEKVESCKTQLQASHVQGPIALSESEALSQALQKIPRENTEGMSPEEAAEVAMVYDPQTCENLSAEKGLKAYCEGEIEKRIEMEQLKIMLRSNQLDCESFQVVQVRQECDTLL